MVRQIDVRRHRDRSDPTRREVLQRAAAEVSDRVLPGDHRVRIASFDDVTGNPAVVVSDSAAPGGDDYVARALAHVQRIGPALGFAATQPAEYRPDPTTQATSAGSVAVHLRQQYKGIAVYDGAEVVRFDSEGHVLEVAGRSFTVAADLSTTTAVSAEEALRVAAAHVAEGDTGEEPAEDQFGEPLTEPGLDLSSFAPVARTTGADRPDQPTTFDAPPFEHAVTVSLIWFPLDGGLRLAWHTKLAVPGGAVYRLVVDALDARLLLAVRLTRAITGSAEVVLAAGGPRGAVTMPRDLAGYGAPVPTTLPDGFPDDWLLDASTRGASVHAVLAPAGTPVSGVRSGTSVTFAAPDRPDSPDALVVNMFALCSGLHDLLYLLGFREADGNFQTDNRGRGGRSADPVRAVVHPGPVWGTANMGTPPDGRPPLMNMGLVSSTGRHTALDADVVYHEYAHGLTNRLVGGPLDDTALDAVQSGALGEAWSDFVACIALGKSVVGDWVVGRPAGIRRHPYDEQFPDTYADIGTGRYVGDAVHAIGEIWCATLMSLARRIGAWPCAQVVVDALKLTAANPSFLAARDAVLLAARDHATARGDDEAAVAAFVHEVWTVFARYGMGPGARTAAAETLDGIVADFTAPASPVARSTVRASASPALPIPDADPTGVVSAVTLPHAGLVAALTVSVDIAHPYRGDLEVSLVAPGGRQATLHRRTGGRADDLRATFSSLGDDGHPGLAALHGTPVGGTWSLVVADRARRDVGTLAGWSIEAQVAAAPREVAAVSTASLLIPDADSSGVQDVVTLDEGGTLSGLAVEVDITHTYVGDLEVSITGPDGTRATLHGRTGAGADNLIRTYTSDDGGPLSTFLGKQAGGRWTVHVVDHAGQDVGKLNRWAVRARL